MQIKTAFAQLALSNPKVLENILKEADRQSVEALRAIPRQLIEGGRYQVKFVNGIWTIFDRWAFRNCEPGLPSEKAARALLGVS